MSKDAINREDCFSEEVPDFKQRKRFYKVLRPKPQSEVKGIITSDKVLISYTHYRDRNSYICTRNSKTCPFCAASIAPRIKGYLCGVDNADRKAVVLEMTDNAVRDNAVIRERKVSLRGKVLCLSRPGKNPNSPVLARLEDCPHVTVLRSLPQPFDLRAVLLEMWDVPSQQLLYDRHPETPELSEEVFNDGSDDTPAMLADAWRMPR